MFEASRQYPKRSIKEFAFAFANGLQQLILGAAASQFLMLLMWGLMQRLQLILDMVISNRLNHAGFLEPILQDKRFELDDRQMRRRLRLFWIRVQQTRDEFDWHFIGAIRCGLVFDLASR